MSPVSSAYGWNTARLYNVFWSQVSSRIGPRLVQASSDRCSGNRERIASEAFDLGKVAVSIKNAINGTNEPNQALHIVKVEKQVMVATMRLLVAQIGTLKAHKNSLNNFLVNLDTKSRTDKIRNKSNDVYNRLSLEYVGMFGKMLTIVTTCCARKAAEISFVAGAEKWKWSHPFGNVSCSGVIISSEAMIAELSTNFISRSEKTYRLSPLSEVNQFKTMLPQEIAADP